MSAAVVTTNLEKHYGAVAALAGISIELPAGSVTWLSGPNGAGKSTLLRILAGCTRPTRGEVRLDGHDPFGAGAAERRAHTAFVGALPGLYAELSVVENLRFCARLHGLGPESVMAALETLGLEAHADRTLRALSLGYRRRTALARALLGSPRLLLLDEPWNGLDREASATLVQIVRSHAAGGGTALIAAHAAAEPGLFDRALELRAGRVVDAPA